MSASEWSGRKRAVSQDRQRRISILVGKVTDAGATGGIEVNFGREEPILASRGSFTVATGQNVAVISVEGMNLIVADGGGVVMGGGAPDEEEI